MNRLAVIIPYHSTPAELESSLLSLLENRPKNCEICVVLNQPYENIYELSEEEVLFLNVEKQPSEENRSVADSVRFGLTACDSSYVYMMPAGVQFQSEWLEALEIMDQSEDLGAFFLDANLVLGGFFRKPLLESFLQNSEDSGVRTESDVECLANLVSLMQDANLPCGLAEFETVEEELKTEAGIKPEVSHDSETDSQIENGKESEIKSDLGTETKVENERKAETELEPIRSAKFPEETGLLARLGAWVHGFFK